MIEYFFSCIGHDVFLLSEFRNPLQSAVHAQPAPARGTEVRIEFPDDGALPSIKAIPRIPLFLERWRQFLNRLVAMKAVISSEVDPHRSSGSTLPSRRLSIILRSTLIALVPQPELARPQVGIESRVINAFLMRINGNDAGSKGFIFSDV
jgi:hypothetical protein